MLRLNGKSLATAVLARCLQRAGSEFVLVDGGERRPLRPQFVCINDVAIALLRDLFPGVFSQGREPGYSLGMREVIWSDDPVPQRIRQEAIVVDLGHLTQVLLDDLDVAPVEKVDHPVVLDVNPASDAVRFLSVGDRAMLVTQVDLANPIEPARSLVESLLDGWLFLAPTDKGSAVLQAMVPLPPDNPRKRLRDMLGQSSLIAPYVGGHGQIDVIPAAPGVHLPLIDDGKIFVGGAGVRLDPVSGEGVPFAIRSAMLAAAVLTHRGQAETVQAHYFQRTLTSFLSHLSGCRNFYAEAFADNPAWQLEMQKSAIAASALKQAIVLPDADQFRFRLEGFRLVRCDEDTPLGTVSQSTEAMLH